MAEHRSASNAALSAVAMLGFTTLYLLVVQLEDLCCPGTWLNLGNILRERNHSSLPIRLSKNHHG